ncbi:MAG: A/G-specific adenine glycosylase [Phycisphaerales bacterium]|nr:A/G-specific adenine glycosylase [Phycisphaerales bacterium]
MLQQTQVSRVVPAFERFIERFPDPGALARAPERDVLAHWQGLGYYRRARLLHAAARHVVDRHDGKVPTAVSPLRELPGVGRYVAGAIASIVGGAREPIVDGNVARVMLRLHGRAAAPDEPDTVKWLWSRAQDWVDDAHDPSLANEGLMELGATVCTPRSPRCGECPLARRCAARRQGTVDSIPAPKRAARAVRQRRERIAMVTLVAVHRGRIAMERRPDDGLWAGMWQTPAREVSLAVASERIGAVPRRWRGARHAGAVDAVLSHRHVQIDVWLATSAAAARLKRGSSRAWSWVPIAKVGELPLSNAMRRVLELGGVRAPDPARPLRARGAARAEDESRASGDTPRAGQRRAARRTAGTVRA